MGNCCLTKQGKDQLNSNKCNNKCSMNEFEQRIYPLIDNLKLDKYQKSILKKRFAKLVIQYEQSARKIDCKYNSCRIIISVGSMILPTLQTIQNNENVAEWKNEIFWAAIATSLGVMISNNLISMFALDRRYIMYSITTEKLKSIGWKYFELSDMFSGKTHKENWVMFWNEVEKIKKLQMIAEFTDHDDKQDNAKDDSLLDKNSFSDSDYDSDDDNKKKEKVKLKEVVVENTITEPPQQKLTHIGNDSQELINNIDSTQLLNTIKSSQLINNIDPSQLTNSINPSQLTNIINDPSQLTNIIKDTTENNLNNIQNEVINNVKEEVKKTI